MRTPNPPPHFFWTGTNIGESRWNRGFTLLEVSLASGLVLFALASIYAMQAQTLQIVRSAHDSNSASQILQQRAEQLRLNPYKEVATASGLLALMSEATDSESEMTGVSGLTEVVTVSPATGTPAFMVTRRDASATPSPRGGTATLAAQNSVSVRLEVTWSDRTGNHSREFSTVLSNGGVSRAGIAKTAETSVFAGAVQPASITIPELVPAPDSTGTARPGSTSGVCARHGRPRPHCGK